MENTSEKKKQTLTKFKVVGRKPGKYNFHGFGEIDLANISDAYAEILVKRGFKYLEPIKKDDKSAGKAKN